MALAVLLLLPAPTAVDAQFSDANWFSFGAIPGVNGSVNAVAVDASGNRYIGGSFTSAGQIPATNVAQWNGGAWSALGAGVGNTVYALAVLNGTVFAGGGFFTAGGNAAFNIAQWNGSAWPHRKIRRRCLRIREEKGIGAEKGTETLRLPRREKLGPD